MTTELPEWVSDHKKRLLELYDNVSQLDTESTDLHQACAILVEISLMKSEMGLIYEEMSNRVQQMMKQEEIIDLDSGYTVERRWSKPRKAWQHKELGSIVANRIKQSSIDLDTGEVTLSPEEMITKMLDFVQPSYWRVGALSEIGISADEYCETGDPVEKISIRNNK